MLAEERDAASRAVRQAGDRQQLRQAEHAHLRQRQGQRSLRDHPDARRRRSGLSEAEQKLYDLVARRFMSVFFPRAEYLVTTRISQAAGHSFRTEGKVLVKPGWLAIYGQGGAGRDRPKAPQSLVPVKPGEIGARRNRRAQGR